MKNPIESEQAAFGLLVRVVALMVVVIVVVVVVRALS